MMKSGTEMNKGVKEIALKESELPKTSGMT